MLASWAARRLPCLCESALSCGNSMRAKRTEVLRTDQLPASWQSQQAWGGRHPYPLPRERPFIASALGGSGRGRRQGLCFHGRVPALRPSRTPRRACRPCEECSPRPALVEAPSGSRCTFGICFRVCERLCPLSRATPLRRRWRGSGTVLHPFVTHFVPGPAVFLSLLLPEPRPSADPDSPPEDLAAASREAPNLCP